MRAESLVWVKAIFAYCFYDRISFDARARDIIAFFDGINHFDGNKLSRASNTELSNCLLNIVSVIYKRILSTSILYKLSDSSNWET